MIVYECFYPDDDDEDKVRGRGDHFVTQELKEIFKHLSETYEVEFVRPKPIPLNKKTLNRIDSIIKEVDCICFYVEKKPTSQQE